MAVFDPTEQRMCVRVVYDGAAGAGKTTNVRQLGMLFAAQRTTEVISPAELRGRTLYFDWMQIAAGAVCGFPLICQVVSVPGQAALSGRRRELLASADVVVFVCDSSRDKLWNAREALLLADDLVLPSGEPLPVVIQANKQDQLDAVDGKTLLASTRLPNAQVVEAIATEGIGVVDTFVTAVRVASRAIQTRSDRQGGHRIPVCRVEDEDQLLARLAAAPIDRDGAADLLLEEASIAFMLAEAPPRAPVPLLVDAPAPAPPPQPEPDADRESAVKIARFPNVDVPTGFVWPAHTGRALLRALELEGTVPVGPRGVEHGVLDRVLRTSLEQRFPDADSARHALVRAARERTQLATLLVSDTVLVVQPAADGASWLWMVTPKTQPVLSWVALEARTRLVLLGSAIADAVASTLRHALAFLPRVDGFGVHGTAIRYVGPLRAAEEPAQAAVDLVFGVLDDVGAFGLDVEAFAAALARRLEERLRVEELAVMAADCPAVEPAGNAPSERARAWLIRAIRRVSVAA